MKQTICILITILVSLLGAEEVPMTENPAAPAVENAGRTVVLKEVLDWDFGDRPEFHTKLFAAVVFVLVI
jgi:hypothetical protein